MQDVADRVRWWVVLTCAHIQRCVMCKQRRRRGEEGDGKEERSDGAKEGEVGWVE